MNLSAIFSKTGKGVQEASGKTSHLSRADRAVLSAIDGKTPLTEVQRNFEKLAGPKFEALIQQLDKDGYIREVSTGQAAAPTRPAAPAAKAPPPKPAAPAQEEGDGLDFTQAIKFPPKAPAAPAAPKPPPVDLAASARADAERRVKEQQAIDYKTRQEVELRAKAEADQKVKTANEARLRADAEAKAREAAEAKARADADAKTRAESDAKVKAAREAAMRLAADAKVKTEAAERDRQAAAEREREANERARKESEDKARIEADLNAKLGAERKAREDAEKRATEAAERARKELEEKAKRDEEIMRQRLEEEMKAKLEAERKARDEEERKRREEEAKKRADEDRRRKEEDERRAREEAERRAKEEAERKKREEEDRKREEEAKKRREEDERRRKEEDERRAKEDAERRAKEESERKKREEEDRKREEEAKKRREEDERRREEEDERRAKDDAERKALEDSNRKLETDRRARDEAERKAKDDAERRAREESDAKSKAEAEKKAKTAADAAASLPKLEAVAPPTPPAAPAAGGDLGDLLGDLDSFGKREEEEQKEKEEAERKAKEEKARRDKEAAERKAKDDAERLAKEEADKKRRKEEEEQREKEEERRAKEEEEQKEKDEAERKRKTKEAAAAKQAEERAARNAEKGAAKGGKSGADEDIDVSDTELDLDDLKRDQKVAAEKARKAAKEAPVVSASVGRPRKFGKPVAIALFVLLIAGVGVLHVMPVSTADYEKAASDAMGAPVKISSARLSVISGIEVKFEGVTIGSAVKIRNVRASPEVGSLFGSRKAFSRVDLEGLQLAESQLGDALTGKVSGENFRIGRITAKQVVLEGPFKVPPLDLDATVAGDGTLQTVKLTGNDKLVVTLQPKGGDIGFEISAGSLSMPFVPALSLSEFGMKGTANRNGVVNSEFDGRAYDGIISGTSRIRWGDNWTVDGELRARGVKVAVFAPTLVSDGKVEARGAYNMSGSTPATLFESARLQGEYKIEKGVLGSFDLQKALQSGGAAATGRTIFNELSGQGTYDKGAVQFTNVSITAGAMNAGASLNIDASGNLAGRVVADVKTQAQTLRATLSITGKLQEPVIRK